MNLIRMSKLLTIMLFSLFLVGCVFQDSSESSQPSNPLQITNEVKGTSTPYIDSNPSPIIITTEAPTFQDQSIDLENLYENNGGCELPCWWGITPGKSIWQDTMNSLLSLGADIGQPYGTSKIVRYDVYFGKVVEAAVEDVWPGIWVQNGVVKAISINSSWVSKDFGYSLSELLKRFDVPEEIWIRPVTDTGDNQLYYYLVLMYPSEGILIELLGNAEKNNDHLSVCPQDIFSRSPYPPGVLLWNPNEQISFKQFGVEVLDDDLGWILNEYHLLQEVTPNKLSDLEFYNIYSQVDTDSCMNVSPVR